MSDVKDEDELIPVETPIEDPKVEDPKVESPDIEADEDEEDERLAKSEDDSDDEITASRKRRLQRRDARNRARERQERELAMLREQVAMLSQRVGGVETSTAGAEQQGAEARIREAIARAEQAELIMARAIEAGNGEDATAALRIRDAARAEAQQLYTTAQSRPQTAPPVAQYAGEWVKANPWYDPSGRDADSQLTKQIDSQLAAEGFDPNTRAYWEELSDRVRDAFEGRETKKTPEARTGRKGPPVGDTREHAPTSTRKEIYVTPERKQAMIEAGAWDDPQKRQRMLKAYADFDRGSARQ